jgi:hypothetical protein
VCIGGVLGFLISAGFKLLAYSSLVPVSEEWSLISEILKESITLVDLYVINTVFTWKMTRSADKRTRMLGVGLGWGAAEMICSHLLIFIVNAGSGEFSWEYLQRAISANWSLFQLIATACLVYSRSNTSGFWKVVSEGLLVGQILFRPLALGYLAHVGLLTSWGTVAAQALWSAGFLALGKLIIEFTS